LHNIYIKPDFFYFLASSHTFSNKLYLW